MCNRMIEDCNHDVDPCLHPFLQYCPACDKVFCKTCGRVWAREYSYTASADNSSFTVSYWGGKK